MFNDPYLCLMFSWKSLLSDFPMTVANIAFFLDNQKKTNENGDFLSEAVRNVT